MNQEKQPEAMRLAEALANNQRWHELTDEECESASAELLRQHALIEWQHDEMNAYAAIAAEEKLRANQMTEQHRMQSNIRADVEAERDRFRAAYNEWHDKTEWVQETARPKELGMHRADVLRNRIADLEAQLSAIGAGGVESLRKRDGLQQSAEVVEPEFFTVFASHNGGKIALPGYSNETEKGVKDLVLQAARQEGYKGTVAGRLLELGWWIGPVFASSADAAALQAAPPAPAAVAVPLKEALAMFPMQLDGQTFTVVGVNNGKPLEADGDNTFYSKRKVVAFLTELRGHIDAALASTPAQAVAVGAYPPINPKDFDSDSDFIAYLDAWRHAAPGKDAGEKIEWLNKHIHRLMHAYVDDDRARQRLKPLTPAQLKQIVRRVALEIGRAPLADDIELAHAITSAVQASPPAQSPDAPACLTCSDHGAVGNMLTAEPCPDCTPVTPAQEHATQLAGQGQEPSPGFALVPLRLTRAMEKVLQEEDWQWAALLAAADALSEEDHDALSRDDLTDAEVFAVADPLFAHQQIGGRVPSQDLDGFRELIGSALSDAVPQRAAPAQAQEDARDAARYRAARDNNGPMEVAIFEEAVGESDWTICTGADADTACDEAIARHEARKAHDAARAAQGE